MIRRTAALAGLAAFGLLAVPAIALAQVPNSSWSAISPVPGVYVPPAFMPPLPGPQVGEPAPNFSLTTTDGKRVRLADYRGHVLVINVWGSWCPPCRLETPDLIAEAKRDGGEVAFLGIDTTESAGAVRAFATAKGVPYPQVATTGESAFAHDYAIRNYPTTFVIDGAGVLRARHADNLLPAAQLRAYVAAAQHGASAPLDSAFQRQLDALLAPANYPFTGDPVTVRANVRRAAKAIEQADAGLDDAMDDAARDHDLIATQSEEEVLRAAAIAALTPIVLTDDDRQLLADLRGDEAVARGDWAGADSAYGAALAIDPGDRAALGGQAYAASQTGNLPRVASLDAKIAELAPSPASFVGLAKADAAINRPADALAAFRSARQLAAGEMTRLAWVNLYEGASDAEHGLRSAAAAAFARASEAAAQIPNGDQRREWYIERAQEGALALAIAPGAAPAISLAPWTGPDLPGSIASTQKFRLIVSGKPGSAVALVASGLPAHWIASFCTDRVCAPFRTSVTLPSAGAKIVELQIVPTTRSRGAHAVHVAAQNAAGHVFAGASAPVTQE